MRKTVGAILNIGGVALLLVAALLAWQTYNPDRPPHPGGCDRGQGAADAGSPSLDEQRRCCANACCADRSAGHAPGAAQDAPPLLLPETKLPATAVATQASASLPGTQPTAPDADIPAPSERKANIDQLEAARAKAFPPPAQSLPPAS